VLERIIHFSIRQRWFVLFATFGLIGLGIFSFQRLPIDALPDITNVQVQINSEAPGYSPLEVEQRITYPVETALAGLPYLLETRSISRYGLSQVTVVFDEGTDIYFARQLINSRLQEVKEQLPMGIQPIMGPIATGLGEIFMWSLEWEEGHPRLDDPFDAMVELRTVQDWIIRPQLRTVPGVAEINSIGGYVKQYQVAPDPEKLMAFNITFHDVVQALLNNNANVGAGYVEHSGEQYLIRAPGQVVSEEEIAQIVIGTHRGVPIHIFDVAEVKIAKELRTGAATQNGRETVLGTVFMLKGENSRTVSLRVAEKMKAINRTLPAGIKTNIVYDRTNLVNATLETVRDNLAEGALFVILVLFLLLGNFRAALITALVIPLSMLFAISGMVTNKISGNLLSLGAIDFGIIIDSAVIIVENCVRRMGLEQARLKRELKPEERHFIVQQAAVEVSRPSIFGVFIIMIVYLPILTLTGIEGKMFQPMAFTVLAALTGALILSLTFVPAMVAQFATGRISEKKNYLLEWARRIYAPLLHMSLNNRGPVTTLAGVLVVLSLLMGTRLGTEFIPTLDEKDMAVHALRIPGTGLDQAVSMQYALEKKITEFPEVDYVFAKIGTAEIATDPMPPSVADVFVMMHPRSLWPNPKKLRTTLVAEMEHKLTSLPGNKYEFTQPIQMRFNELIAGVRSDVAVKVHGDNLDILLEEAERISHVLETVPGATDVRVEQVTGLPVLTIQLNRKEMARLGLNISDVQDVIEIAIGGKQAGQLFQGDRRFDLIVRLPDDIRNNIPSLKRIPLPYPEGLAGAAHPGTGSATVPGQPLSAFITLGAVADFKVIKGPNQISRENGKRRVVVTANVRGRDLGSFVEQAQAMIQNKLKFPSGYWITWGGTYEHLISATKRLYVVVPVALLLIFMMLFAAFGSTTQALIIFTGVPLAWTGGIVSLWLRGIPLSISAAVGFIALSGVAVLNGVVMISFINKLREEGMDLGPAVVEGSLTRLRPVLMTALVASLGFLPMALATGTGAEVQRPLATVVIGGILSSTALTLLVLPALYEGFHKKIKR